MKIRQATVKDKKEAMAIAKSLNEWFNKDGIKNMAIDFKMNHVIVAKEKKKVLGFLSYTTYSIKVETLPEEDIYKPYERTRAFYYKNGFERVLYKKARVKGWDDQIVLEKKIK